MKRRLRTTARPSTLGTPRSRTPPATSAVAAESWLAQHSGWLVFVLVAASIVTRAVYFVQLRASPAIELHRWDQTDMNYFDGWGGQIARGDWLSASIAVPMHEWQRLV